MSTIIKFPSTWASPTGESLADTKDVAEMFSRRLNMYRIEKRGETIDYMKNGCIVECLDTKTGKYVSRKLSLQMILSPIDTADEPAQQQSQLLQPRKQAVIAE